MSSTPVAIPLRSRRTSRAIPRDARVSRLARAVSRPSETTIAVVLTGAVYLVAGALLVFRYDSIQGDALAHVNNGALTILSRDPHMAAVGFVWNPLPSFLAVPILLFRPLFPALLSQGFAGNIISAATGAACAGVLLGILRDWGLSKWVRWILVLAFALHPLVLYYGANGMTEAPYLLFLLLSCRYLGRWLRTRATADLVACGVALGVGYFVRYEVLAAGAGVGLLVLVCRYVWSSGGFRTRARESIADFGIVIAPIAFAFVAWAVASFIIVGSAFEQFTSVYGNTSQLSVNGGQLGAPSGLGALHFVVRQLLLLSAALPVAVVLPLIVGYIRRESAILAPWAVFGSILAFQALAYERGQEAGWLRYYIVVIPLVILAAATLLVDRRRDVKQMSWARLPVALIASAIALAGVISGTGIVRDTQLAREETEMLGAVLDRGSASQFQKDSLSHWKNARDVANYVESLHPGRGKVLIDSFQGFVVTTQAKNLKMFVVTSDRDFKPILADPQTFKIKYIVVPDQTRGVLDAINRAYPTMYDSGAGIATLQKEFKSDSNFPDFRVYKVIPSETSS
jgi:hypothetical protein